MDLRWLEDFLAVAETRNFTKAAGRRHVSQAAFSRRIQALEDYLGFCLLDRSAYPVSLTEEGVCFRRHAQAILSQVARAKTDMNHSGSGERPRSRRVTSVTTAASAYDP